MRRRIALFANGWGTECLREVGYGAESVAKNNDIDIFAFVNYAANADVETNKLGEFNIFTIPNLTDFDGAIVLANSFNTQLEKDYLTKEIAKAGIPAIAAESRLDGMGFCGIDDYLGMSEIVEHLITEHGVKDILFMGGIKGHEGNSLRLKAVIETAAKHNVIIPEENIIYGDFAARESILSLTEWRKKHTLPEAIICANDIMALGICDHLRNEGIQIPEDVKITGFDCLKSAGVHEPSITTVNRDWRQMGRDMMEDLLERMDNGDRHSKRDEVILGSVMIRGESCGCMLKEDEPNTWNSLGNIRNRVEFNGFDVDQHYRHMFLAMRKMSSIDEMCEGLSQFYISESWLEGNDVMLALTPDFFKYSEEEVQKTITMGYPKEMDAVCLICDGKKNEYRRAKTSSLIFENANRKSVPGVYLFAPIRNDREMFGFIMTSRGFSIVMNDVLYILTRHMSQYLEQVKSNIAINHLTQKLRALSITDALTGVYNRAGCETIIYGSLEENQRNGGQSVVMLADVDRLKAINDRFGHGAGDTAIKLSISILKDYLPEEYMIGRYGGDEFLIAAPLNKNIDGDRFAQELMDKISKNPMTKEYPYKISMSIGCVQLSSGEEFKISDALRKMDDKVYKIKAVHHSDEDKM